MLKTILIAVAQLAIIYGGPVVLLYGFGWPDQERAAVAWHGFVLAMLIGGLLGLPSVNRFIIGMATPSVSIVLFALVHIWAEKWSGMNERDLFHENYEIFIGLFTVIWILVPCGMWYVFRRYEKDRSFVG